MTSQKVGSTMICKGSGDGGVTTNLVTLGGFREEVGSDWSTDM